MTTRTCSAARRTRCCLTNAKPRAALAAERPGRGRGPVPELLRRLGRAGRARDGHGDPVTAYAFARTGYHRGLDQLRRAGWHGHGPIPWEHEPNQGFLRALHMLGVAAAAIGEDDEATRCREFLADSSRGGCRRRWSRDRPGLRQPAAVQPASGSI